MKNTKMHSIKTYNTAWFIHVLHQPGYYFDPRRLHGYDTSHARYIYKTIHHTSDAHPPVDKISDMASR